MKRDSSLKMWLPPDPAEDRKRWTQIEVAMTEQLQKKRMWVNGVQTPPPDQLPA